MLQFVKITKREEINDNDNSLIDNNGRNEAENVESPNTDEIGFEIIQSQWNSIPIGFWWLENAHARIASYEASAGHYSAISMMWEKQKCVRIDAELAKLI